MQQDIVTGRSKIDNTFIMHVVYPSYNKWDTLQPLFKKHGYAMIMPSTKVMYIDGQAIEDLSKDQFYAIQAHEIAHHILKHKGHYTADQEREADVAGIAILQHLQYNLASKALEDRAIQSYGRTNLSLKPQQLALLKAYTSSI